MTKLEMDKYIAKQILSGYKAYFRRDNLPFRWRYIEYEMDVCGCIEDPHNWEFWEEDAEKDEYGNIYRSASCTECEDGETETGRIIVIAHGDDHEVPVESDELTPCEAPSC